MSCRSERLVVTRMEDTNRVGESHHRSLITAAAVASFMMLIFGVTYRVVAAKLATPVKTKPIAQEVLDRLPLQIGKWKGQDVPLDKEIIRQTDTDALVNRQYTQEGSLKAVSYYVAAGVRVRDMEPHRPEVCYVGAGWTRIGRRTVELSLGGTAKLPCQVFEFSRGGLNAQKVVVLYYYIVDGQYSSDVSSLRWKAWWGSEAIGYVAQVEVVASKTQGGSAEELVCEFAIQSAFPTAELFRHQQGRTEAKQ
jgi:EpsI family protein